MGRAARTGRLRAAADFARVREAARAWSHPLLVLLVTASPAGDAPTRVGVSVGRRVGGAVARNRLRRQIRESLRLRYDSLAQGHDLVFVARPAAAGASFAAIDGAVGSLLGRAGLTGRRL